MPRRNRHTEAVNKKGNSRKALYLVVAVVLSIIVTSSIIGALKRTLFFEHKDRINIVLYGKNTTYYSLGIHTDGDYAMIFPADLKMDIPGGYGQYRVGALGKLVSLEKKPTILQNTFSLATYSFTDYYFYTSSEDVFYGNDSSFMLPSIKFLWSSTSNAHLLDRLYLLFYFLNKKDNDFHQVNVLTEKNGEGDEVLATSDFEKSITGYLFQQSYRTEAKSVQILYSDNYESAVRIGKMLQGNGIKVGDISQNGSFNQNCIVQENSSSESITAEAIVNTFNCRWQKGQTDFYDIIFKVGQKEKDWEIK